MENQYYNTWQEKRVNSINLLFKESHFESAVELCWIYIREHIFNHNLNNQISYNSTEEAITRYFLNCEDLKLKYIIHFFYTANITINWGKEIAISSIEGEYMRREFDVFLNKKSD